MPVTVREALPPLDVNTTVPFDVVPGEVGVNRTVTLWLAPGARLKDAPPVMLNGAVVAAVPTSVPLPVFFTVKLWSFDAPRFSFPKFSDDGETVRTGGAPPVPLTGRVTVPPFDVNTTLPGALPVTVGAKRTQTSWLVPAARLNELPDTMPYGADVATVPVSVPAPVFCTVNF